MVTITPHKSPRRTTYWRLRQRYDEELQAARESGASAAVIDDLYVAAAFIRNLDPELIRLRRRRWAP